MKRIYRSNDDKRLTGLCGGLGEYLSVDPTLVRVIVLIAVIMTFPVGPICYVIAAAIVPKQQETTHA